MGVTETCTGAAAGGAGVGFVCSRWRRLVSIPCAAAAGSGEHGGVDPLQPGVDPLQWHSLVSGVDPLQRHSLVSRLKRGTKEAGAGAALASAAEGEDNP